MQTIKILLTAIALLSLAASCGSDDNEPTYATEIAGTYKGDTRAVSQYFPEGMEAADQTLVITKNGSAYSATMTSDTWGEFDVNNITATTTDKGATWNLDGKGKTKMGMGGNINEYDCNFTGTIDAMKENTSFVFTVPAVMGGLTITFTAE